MVRVRVKVRVRVRVRVRVTLLSLVASEPSTASSLSHRAS